MPFDANGCVSTLVNVDWIKWRYFYVSEFEVGVNDSIFSGNEIQKVQFGIAVVHAGYLTKTRWFKSEQPESFWLMKKLMPSLLFIDILKWLLFVKNLLK